MAKHLPPPTDLPAGTAFCRACMSAKPASDFASNKSRPNGLSFYCRECSTAYQVTWLGTPKGAEAVARIKARRDAASAEKRARRLAEKAARERDRATKRAEAGEDWVASVYVMEAGGFVKIGVSKQTASRAADIQTSCPHDVRVVYATAPLNRVTAFALERRLHAHFADRTAAAERPGEWFRVPAEEAADELKRREIFDEIWT